MISGFGELKRTDKKEFMGTIEFSETQIQVLGQIKEVSGKKFLSLKSFRGSELGFGFLHRLNPDIPIYKGAIDFDKERMILEGKLESSSLVSLTAREETIEEMTKRLFEGEEIPLSSLPESLREWDKKPSLNASRSSQERSKTDPPLEVQELRKIA